MLCVNDIIAYVIIIIIIMDEYFIYQHRYNTVKTVKSRTVSIGSKGSKSTYNCPKRYVNEETHCTITLKTTNVLNLDEI